MHRKIKTGFHWETSKVGRRGAGLAKKCCRVSARWNGLGGSDRGSERASRLWKHAERDENRKLEGGSRHGGSIYPCRLACQVCTAYVALLPAMARATCQLSSATDRRIKAARGKEIEIQGTRLRSTASKDRAPRMLVTRFSRKRNIAVVRMVKQSGQRASA